MSATPRRGPERRPVHTPATQNKNRSPALARPRRLAARGAARYVGLWRCALIALEGPYQRPLDSPARPRQAPFRTPGGLAVQRRVRLAAGLQSRPCPLAVQEACDVAGHSISPRAGRPGRGACGAPGGLERGRRTGRGPEEGEGAGYLPAPIIAPLPGTNPRATLGTAPSSATTRTARGYARRPGQPHGDDVREIGRRCGGLGRSRDGAEAGRRASWAERLPSTGNLMYSRG